MIHEYQPENPPANRLMIPDRLAPSSAYPPIRNHSDKQIFDAGFWTANRHGVQMTEDPDGMTISNFIEEDIVINPFVLRLPVTLENRYDGHTYRKTLFVPIGLQIIDPENDVQLCWSIISAANDRLKQKAFDALTGENIRENLNTIMYLQFHTLGWNELDPEDIHNAANLLPDNPILQTSSKIFLSYIASPDHRSSGEGTFQRLQVGYYLPDTNPSTSVN
jgi:hypothetical protein